MGLFDINQLTGHVRILTRREKARQTASVPSQGGTPERMKEAAVLITCNCDGAMAVASDTLPADERYIIVQLAGYCFGVEGFSHLDAGIAGLTLDLKTLFPNGFPKGVSYYLITNQTQVDFNIVVDAEPLLRPTDTIIKAGGCREVSLYVGEAGHVLTISDDLQFV